MSDELVKITVYVTDDTRMRLLELAEQERRSLSSQASVMLEDSLEQFEAVPSGN